MIDAGGREKSLNHDAVELIIWSHQYARSNTYRTVEAQLFRLLGIKHLLEIDLHAILLLRIVSRGSDTGELFNVLPDIEQPGDVRLQVDELPRRQGGKDRCSKYVLFHCQPHAKV